MFWTLSFELLPEEEIIDDTADRDRSGIKSAYSLFLTNKRVIFRFDGLGSSLSQSFFYNEITDVSTSRRLFITYLEVKTKKKRFLFHIADAPYWLKRILEIKNEMPTYEESRLGIKPSAAARKRELLDMLTVLRRHDLLSDVEVEEKIHLLDSMQL